MEAETMKIVTIQSALNAHKVLAGGADVAVVRDEIERGSCHVMVRSDDDNLPSRIAQQFGWEEAHRSDGYVCLSVPGNQANEVISALGSLTL